METSENSKGIPPVKALTIPKPVTFAGCVYSKCTDSIFIMGGWETSKCFRFDLKTQKYHSIHVKIPYIKPKSYYRTHIDVIEYKSSFEPTPHGFTAVPMDKEGRQLFILVGNEWFIFDCVTEKFQLPNVKKTGEGSPESLIDRSRYGRIPGKKPTRNQIPQKQPKTFRVAGSMACLVPTGNLVGLYCTVHNVHKKHCTVHAFQRSE